jgi:hypothetical protein
MGDGVREERGCIQVDAGRDVLVGWKVGFEGR